MNQIKSIALMLAVFCLMACEVSCLETESDPVPEVQESFPDEGGGYNNAPAANHDGMGCGRSYVRVYLPDHSSVMVEVPSLCAPYRDTGDPPDNNREDLIDPEELQTPELKR